MPDLPDGWQKVRLADCGTWLSGGTPSTDEPRFWGGDIPWISAASLKEFNITDSDRRITRAGTSGTRLVSENCVLLVVRGMSLKSEFRVGVTQRRVAFGQDCKAIIPAPLIDGRFLAYALKSRARDVLAMVDEAGHGTGRLPTDLLARMAIAIPPHAEQRQIVNILDAVEGEICKVQKLIDKNNLLWRGLLESAFKEVASSAPWCSLGELSLVGGDYGSNSPTVPLGEGMPRYVRITDIDDRGRLKSDSVVGHARAGARPYLLHDGDLLIARTGFTTGKSLLYRREYGECVFAGYLVRFTFDQSKVLPEYVFLWTQGREFARWVNQTVREVGQRNISACEYAQHRLPVPPVALQRKIVERVTGADALGDFYRKSLRKLRQSKEALMEDLLTGRVRVPL